MTAPLCFVDTETTGLHPDRRAWEIALIRRDGGTCDELLIHLRDLDLSNADPYALKLSGLYDRHPDYAGELGDYDPVFLTEAQAAEDIEEWTRGAHLVGVNPAFDAGTLDPMLRRHGFLPAWHYHLVDVGAMAIGYLNGVVRGAVPERQARMANLQELGVADLPPMPDLPEPIAPPWKSDELGRLLGVEPASEADRHTALGDARWAMRMYDAMVGVER